MNCDGCEECFSPELVRSTVVGWLCPGCYQLLREEQMEEELDDPRHGQAAELNRRLG